MIFFLVYAALLMGMGLLEALRGVGLERFARPDALEAVVEEGGANLSGGEKKRVCLARALLRDTELLILDEPASPLDPLMRDRLCDMIREYLEQGGGEKSVFFSTHNIADMENVTDYAVILEHGNIVEEGFVEDLKEKYIAVKGEAADAERARDILLSMSRSAYGFEGICLAEDMEKLAGMDVAFETPGLSQICVAVMKANTKLKI